MNFPLKQTTSAGPIDLQAVVDKSAQGLNVDEQKKNVTARAGLQRAAPDHAAVGALR